MSDVRTFANGFGAWHALVPRDSTNPEVEAQVHIWREVQTREAPRVLPIPTVKRADLHDTETHLAYVEDDWSSTEHTDDGIREVPRDPIPDAVYAAQGKAEEYRPALDLLDQIEKLESQYATMTNRNAVHDRTYRSHTLGLGDYYMPPNLEPDDVFAKVFLEDGADPDALDDGTADHYWQATRDAIGDVLAKAGHDTETYEKVGDALEQQDGAA